jgi:hypothetical protein
MAQFEQKHPCEHFTPHRKHSDEKEGMHGATVLMPWHTRAHVRFGLLSKVLQGVLADLQVVDG